VLVRDGHIVGRGRHIAAGRDHAEICALKDAVATAAGSDLYVTLEPCCHYGRTGPCTEAIIAAGVSRVVVGCLDPNPQVAGGGILALQRAGLAVEAGVLQFACERLIAGHAKFMRRGLPYVVWKYAMTMDGKVATAAGESRWITGERARSEVHRLRRTVDAVAVGIGTVLADDPRLTPRPAGTGPAPYRLVFDSKARLPLDSALLAEAVGQVVVFVSEDAPAARCRALRDAGALVIEAGKARVSAAAALRTAADQLDVREVLLESGPELSASFLAEGLVDEIVCFVSGKLFGGRDAPGPCGGAGIRLPADAPAAKITRMRRFDEDVALYGLLASEDGKES
jgi:diaminohydroxyphosphoribosylaminopyrimidine deaminase/5-amino-6-(5-phosphoribosylamino)uracil reductase